MTIFFTFIIALGTLSLFIAFIAMLVAKSDHPKYVALDKAPLFNRIQGELILGIESTDNNKPTFAVYDTRFGQAISKTSFSPNNMPIIRITPYDY